MNSTRVFTESLVTLFLEYRKRHSSTKNRNDLAMGFASEFERLIHQEVQQLVRQESNRLWNLVAQSLQGSVSLVEIRQSLREAGIELPEILLVVDEAVCAELTGLEMVETGELVLSGENLHSNLADLITWNQTEVSA